MNVSAPKWRWEWNLNTIAVLVGFATMGGGWVYNYAELQGEQRRSSAMIAQMREEISDISQANRTLDNHEFRLTVVERQVSDTSDAMRTLDQTIASLSTDVRVTREILERLERSISSATRTRLNDLAASR